MRYAIGVLVVVVGVLASIALHELGHLVPAKRFGVRVSQYFVGFGPTLWSRTRGETEYGVKAIPLGGYVRLVGMYPTDEAVAAREPRSWLGRVAAEARAASAEEIRPGEDGRAFYRLSAPKKLTVMFGGPAMNLVIAFVLTAVAYVGIGMPGLSLTVGDVAGCVLPVNQSACSAQDTAPGPAGAAGVRVGDTVVSWDGTRVSTWSQLSSLIRADGGRTVPVVVRRDGQDVTLSVTPALAQRAKLDADGNAITAADGSYVTVEAGYVGITPTTVLQRQSIWSVPGSIADTAWQMAKVVVTLPQRAWQVAVQTATGRQRGADSVLSIVGVGRVAGEVASVQGDGIDTAMRALTLLQLLASLNVSLFVFNMIPLPPLDGGHIATALWEGARRRVARLRRLSRPRPADSARLVPLAYAMFLVLGGMSLVLIWADIVNPVRLT